MIHEDGMVITGAGTFSWHPLHRIVKSQIDAEGRFHTRPV